MSLSKDIGLGLSTYGKAISLIFSKGLWGWFAVPVILNIALFWFGFELINTLTDFVKTWFFLLTDLQKADFFLSDWLKDFLSGLIWVVMKIIFFFVFAYFGGFITLIVMSPLLAWLSEKTEQIITGKKYPFNPEQLMRDIVRGILIALRNLLLETCFIILAFTIGFIPIIGWFGAIALFFISSYFYGFSFIDYFSERQLLSIKQSTQLVQKHKGIAIANGSIFSLALLIPFCGATLSGFVAIVSVIAACIAMIETKQQN